MLLRLFLFHSLIHLFVFWVPAWRPVPSDLAAIRTWGYALPLGSSPVVFISFRAHRRGVDQGFQILVEDFFCSREKSVREPVSPQQNEPDTSGAGPATNPKRTFTKNINMLDTAVETAPTKSSSCKLSSARNLIIGSQYPWPLFSGRRGVKSSHTCHRGELYLTTPIHRLMAAFSARRSSFI